MAHQLDALNAYGTNTFFNLDVKEGKLVYGPKDPSYKYDLSYKAIQFIIKEVTSNPESFWCVREKPLIDLALGIRNMVLRDQEGAAAVHELVIAHLIKRHKGLCDQFCELFNIQNTPEALLEAGKKFSLSAYTYLKQPQSDPTRENIREAANHYLKLCGHVDLRTVMIFRSFIQEWNKIGYQSDNYAHHLLSNDILPMRNILLGVRSMGANAFSILSKIGEQLKVRVERPHASGRLVYYSRLSTLGSVEGTITQSALEYSWTGPSMEYSFTTCASSEEEFKIRIISNFLSQVGQFVFSVVTSVPNDQMEAMVKPVIELVTDAKTLRDLKLLQDAVDSIPANRRLQVMRTLDYGSLSIADRAKLLLANR